jgi:hypothetical protein
MGMRFASRTGEFSPREGLEMAYELFADGRPREAAMMFLAYADQDNDLGMVSQSEYEALADHLKEMMAIVAVYNLIIDRQLQPVLTDEMEPAYQQSPWYDENYRPS